MPTLSDRIRAARRLTGLSQSQFSLSLRVERSAVAHWERAQGTTPTTGNLMAIVNLTGVCFEWLAVGRGRMRPSQFPDDLEFKATRVAQDDAEEHLLCAFRRLRPAARNSLMGLLGEISAQSRSSDRRMRQRG